MKSSRYTAEQIAFALRQADEVDPEDWTGRQVRVLLLN